MVTTVQLDNDTKQELVRIKAFLEDETGETKSFNDAIKWLLQMKKSSNQYHERKNVANDLVGTLKGLGISLDDLTELRREKDSRFAKF